MNKVSTLVKCDVLGREKELTGRRRVLFKEKYKAKRCEGVVLGREKVFTGRLKDLSHACGMDCLKIELSVNIGSFKT